MNTTLKRVLGLAGSLALGIAGALTFASAAEAHHVEVIGTAECTDDGWTVTWEATDWNSQNVGAGVIESIDGTVMPEGDLAVGAELPHPSSGETLVGTQTLSLEDTEASLYIDASWPNGNTSSGSWAVAQPEGGCGEAPADPEPAVSTSTGSDCFGIEVAATNDNPDALAEIGFVTSDGETVSHTPEAGEEFVEYFEVTDPEAGLSVTVTVNGEDTTTYNWDGGGNCELGSATETCEGLEFELTAPESGAETTYTFYPSYHDSEPEVVVVLAPGESDTVDFSDEGADFSVSYVVEDGKHVYEGDVPWTKPADCEEEATESPVAEEKLPTTGTSMTIMVASAAALVAAAAALFVIARRRRAAQNW